MSNTLETRSTSHFESFWSLWIFCGSCVGRFVVFGHVWFLALFCASDHAHVVFAVRWSCLDARPIARGLWSLWSRVIVSILEIVDKDINVPGYHGDGTCGFCWSVVVPSMPKPMIARPLALCGLIKRFAHCPASCYVPFRRHWRRPLQMEKTIMARTSVKVRLRNVRIAYPRLFTPDEKTGKRSCLIMIPNDSEAAQAWRRGVAEAWRVAQDELSKASFPDNPSPALTRAMLGIKVAGEISPSGSVYPEEYAGHIVFTASSKRDISVCNNRGNAINATDEELIYSGQIAHVAIELFPFKIPEKTGISRILQNVFIVGGGERINLGSGSNNLSAAEEWADEISESSSSSFDDDSASFPF